MALTQWIKQQAYIDGKWCEGNGKKIKVTNPATGQLLGHVPNMGEDEAEMAIHAAYSALSPWKKQSVKQRAVILREWFNLLLSHAKDFAKIITLEQGKPIGEALNEVQYAASFIEWFAEEGKRIYGDILLDNDKHIMIVKEPVGVCAAITPWNFPLAMITRKVAPALAAGCTIVLKPASDTPFIALALAMLAEQAGIPKGVLNVITGDAKAIGLIMTQHPLVRKFSFTGSTAVGRQLMAQCASTMKKVSFELGGNAPFIVFDDADVDAAVEGAMIAKFRNAGQTCVCANRFLIQRGIYPLFVQKLTEKMQALRVGDGLNKLTDIGPLINQAAADKVKQLLAEAVKQGAKIVLGGQIKQLFCAPTLIIDVHSEMTIFQEEIFAPIVPIVIFEQEEEAVALANNTVYGLAAYFYSQQLSRVWQMAAQLECGMIGINTGLISNEMAPFGGIKQSGLGREGSKYGMEEYLTIKYICIDPK